MGEAALVAVRPIRGTEADALLAASDRLMAGLYRAESTHPVPLDALLAPNAVFLGAFLGENCVGCGALIFVDGDEPYGEIKRLFTDPAVRGRGIAARLVSALEARARAGGLGLVRLETGVRQPAAIGLYQRRGYRRTGPFGGYGEDPMSVFMEKRL